MHNVKLFKQELLKEWEDLPDMILTSSATGYGKDNVLDHIEMINESVISD